MNPSSTRNLNQRLQRISHVLPPILRDHATAASVVSIVAFSAPWLWRNYQAFLALGPGGLPYNAAGWLLALGLKAFEVDVLRTDDFEADEDKRVWLDAENKGLPRRKGSRPYSGFHVAPVRQLDQEPPAEIAAKLDALLNRIISLNTSIVTTGTSPHERHNTGVLIHPAVPSPHAVADQALREIVDVHRSEHSLHVLMAPQDCKTVITHGWGEKHKIGGSTSLKHIFPPQVCLPKEYIWIYAPRTDEELAVVEKILVASIGYMTNTSTEDVKH